MSVQKRRAVQFPPIGILASPDSRKPLQIRRSFNLPSSPFQCSLSFRCFSECQLLCTWLDQPHLRLCLISDSPNAAIFPATQPWPIFPWRSLVSWTPVSCLDTHCSNKHYFYPMHPSWSHCFPTSYLLHLGVYDPHMIKKISFLPRPALCPSLSHSLLCFLFIRLRGIPWPPMHHPLTLGTMLSPLEYSSLKSQPCLSECRFHKPFQGGILPRRCIHIWIASDVTP